MIQQENGSVTTDTRGRALITLYSLGWLLGIEEGAALLLLLPLPLPPLPLPPTLVGAADAVGAPVLLPLPLPPTVVGAADALGAPVLLPLPTEEDLLEKPHTSDSLMVLLPRTEDASAANAVCKTQIESTKRARRETKDDFLENMLMVWCLGMEERKSEFRDAWIQHDTMPRSRMECC